LPEVEITARRLSDGVAGARVESALAPGLVALKTFDPPLEALAGRELDGVRRIGKMLAVESGDLTLLVHLMSAGRLQLFDQRASLRDRASRILVRLEAGRELRRIELRRRPGGGYDATESLFASGFGEQDPLGTAIGPGGALYVTLFRTGAVVRFFPGYHP